MRVALLCWPSDLERPLLALLNTLDAELAGGDWSATDRATKTWLPRRGVPMQMHRHTWTLRRGGALAGQLKIEQEEGNLHFAWSSFTVRQVDARLDDGRRILAEKTPNWTYLTGEGVPLEALRGAAEAAGLPVRNR